MAELVWKKTRDPKAETEPVFHHPGRCMNCGHLESPDASRGINEHHDPAVGCLVAGGTKYIESDKGHGYGACACEKFVPSPESETKNA